MPLGNACLFFAIGGAPFFDKEFFIPLCPIGVGQQLGTFIVFCVVFERCRQGAVSRSDSPARNRDSQLGAMGLNNGDADGRKLVYAAKTIRDVKCDCQPVLMLFSAMGAAAGNLTGMYDAGTLTPLQRPAQLSVA